RRPTGGGARQCAPLATGGRRTAGPERDDGPVRPPARDRRRGPDLRKADPRGVVDGHAPSHKVWPGRVRSGHATPNFTRGLTVRDRTWPSFVTRTLASGSCVLGGTWGFNSPSPTRPSSWRTSLRSRS